MSTRTGRMILAVVLWVVTMALALVAVVTTRLDAAPVVRLEESVPFGVLGKDSSKQVLSLHRLPSDRSEKGGSSDAKRSGGAGQIAEPTGYRPTVVFSTAQADFSQLKGTR